MTPQVAVSVLSQRKNLSIIPVQNIDNIKSICYSLIFLQFQISTLNKSILNQIPLPFQQRHFATNMVHIQSGCHREKFNAKFRKEKRNNPDASISYEKYKKHLYQEKAMFCYYNYLIHQIFFVHSSKVGNNFVCIALIY